MKTYIHFFIAASCFIASSYALADGYKGEAPALPPITIPTLKDGFNVGISALYMTPSSSNLEYLGIKKTPGSVQLAPALRSSQNYLLDRAISPNENWGFILDAGYTFPNSANDIRLAWMAFHSNYTNDHNVSGQAGVSTFVTFFPTSSETLLTDSDFATATATINYKFDALDLTFGQYLIINQQLQTHLFTGLRYTRLDSDMTTDYTATWDTSLSNPTSGSFTGEMNSHFNGIGPMIGATIDYALGKGLGLTGSIDGALLAGQINFDANQFIQESTPENIRNVLTWNTHHIIAPAFDARFGLNYHYYFNNGTQLGFELGYQVSEYYDVIEQIDRDSTSAGFGSSLIVDGITTNNYFDTDVTNFGLNGPYLTMAVRI